MGTVWRKLLPGIMAISAMGSLSSCAGSSLGDVVQRSLEPDSQLAESPPFGQVAPSTPVDLPVEDTETATGTTDRDQVGSASAPSTAEPDTGSDDAQSGVGGDPPRPGDRDFIGPVAAEAGEGERDNPTPLTAIPADLEPYLTDLLALEVLTLRDGATTAEKDAPFAQPISRREYARWLFTVNNRFYADTAANRIRPGRQGDTPAFQDVPPTDPDFAAIQGLAEAGIIPSALTGNSTAVTFRPDAPLTRETLALWKVPLDTRTALPPTTPEAVAATWGFQDANQIEPLALRAIAADFQLGDFANLRRAFGYTTLLQPKKAVTRAEAAATLWRFGTQTEGITAADVRDRP
jgi:hypothetical protein